MLRPSPLFGAGLFTDLLAPATPAFPFADTRYKPHYPLPSDLADVIALVPPGSDDYPTERYASEIASQLQQLGQALQHSASDLSALSKLLPETLIASPLTALRTNPIRSSFGIDVIERTFAAASSHTREQFLQTVATWLGPVSHIETTEFEIFALTPTSASPLTVELSLRYDLVATQLDTKRQERVGAWHLTCLQASPNNWQIHRLQADTETLATGSSTAFADITQQALGAIDSYQRQFLYGVDHWRTVLDGALGTDLYANNGIAAGDFDNDGVDDLYICQPSGLPNRLYRNRGDGTFEDVTDKAGVGVLDNTACALFADFDNRGLQDLLVVCGSGPLLFQNQGDGTFALKRDAFQFAHPPEGTFTHAALADTNNDGRLDIYLCTYQYYLGLDQYHYPAPYYDARNGPANFLMRNAGGGKFIDATEASGLNADNNRYSFACAFGDSNNNGHPDLVIANDFGTSQLYRNNGDGTYTVASRDSHIEDVGAGMSAAWSDFNNDGHQDIYISSMWEAAGQRVSTQPQFHPEASPHTRSLYQCHARGNAMYVNHGDGTFENAGTKTNTAMGRWSWSADFWDVDHDGFPDLYVTNGYISAPNQDDLASFFWRQVVAKSPDDATPLHAYEHGWNAINELVRSDSSWNAFERNVMFANNRNGTFSEVSGVLGLDCLEDSRSFALADIDHDGRLEVILKNRNAPQLRILRNAMQSIGDSLILRLRGHESNRDAVGASVTLQSGDLKQTRYLQAGSGFLAQHSKELVFGLGKATAPITAVVRWPSGLTQTLSALPANHRVEIEEGNDTPVVKPFAAPPAAYLKPTPPPQIAQLPDTVETWLITPLKAPDFSLPALDGTTHTLKQHLGTFTLLHLWSSTVRGSAEQLRHLQQVTPKLQIVAVNIDDADHLAAARTLAKQAALTLPLLFATEDIAGIYNLLFRYLYDRRRDLALPTSFLLDSEGMILKVYQGPVDTAHLLNDIRVAPKTAAERAALALPFKGQRITGTFERNDFTYGIAMFRHGYFEQAADSFQQVVAAQPTNPEAFYNLGTLDLRRNNLAQARQHLERALQLRPNYPEALNNLGMIAAQQGNTAAAVDYFQQSIQQSPSYEIALLNLGNIYRRQGDYARALDTLTHALTLQPNDPEVHYALGMLNAQQNQLAQAAEYLQKAIALRPIYPEALNNLGIINVRLQNLDKARDLFETAIRVAPANDQAYLNLARLYVLQNDKPKAREVLQNLLQLQPQNSKATQALDLLQ
jgi:Flp pilus assembly protein TadD/peroxiredoxin